MPRTLPETGLIVARTMGLKKNTPPSTNSKETDSKSLLGRRGGDKKKHIPAGEMVGRLKILIAGTRGFAIGDEPVGQERKGGMNAED